jgi:hypothetical protein
MHVSVLSVYFCVCVRCARDPEQNLIWPAGDARVHLVAAAPSDKWQPQRRTSQCELLVSAHCVWRLPEVARAVLRRGQLGRYSHHCICLASFFKFARDCFPGMIRDRIFCCVQAVVSGCSGAGNLGPVGHGARQPGADNLRAGVSPYPDTTFWLVRMYVLCGFGTTCIAFLTVLVASDAVLMLLLAVSESVNCILP